MYKQKQFAFFCIMLAAGLVNFNPVLAAGVRAYVDPACVNRAEEEVTDSKTFVGKFAGFVWGDYLHGEFIDVNNKLLNLFINTRDVSCFLALHKDETLEVSYNKIYRYFEEGAGIYPSEEITQIKTEKDNFLEWRREFDFAQNFNSCEGLERKYTRKP